MSRFLYIWTAFEKKGWSTTQEELASDCWWAKEIWKLTSLWTPTGKVIYLTLLIDPMSEFDRNNPPDAVVWAIGLTLNIPEAGLIGEGNCIPIKRNIEQKTKEILALADAMRTST